jgi:hypothetical protein
MDRGRALDGVEGATGEELKGGSGSGLQRVVLLRCGARAGRRGDKAR